MKTLAQSLKEEWTGNAFDLAFNQFAVSAPQRLELSGSRICFDLRIPYVRIMLPEPIAEFRKLVAGQAQVFEDFIGIYSCEFAGAVRSKSSLSFLEPLSIKRW